MVHVEVEAGLEPTEIIQYFLRNVTRRNWDRQDFNYYRNGLYVKFFTEKRVLRDFACSFFGALLVYEVFDWMVTNYFDNPGCFTPFTELAEGSKR